jgi:hypothetical protein
MKFNPRYPLRHLSIRIPWHDSGWNGTICKDPIANGACLALKNCALKRDDAKETTLAGTSLKVLNEPDYPVCIEERATFMADFPIPRTLSHPYAFSSKSTHGHLKPTRVNLPPYSAPAVPYSWMLKSNSKEKKETYDLNYDDQREPELEWEGKDIWVQEYENQKALLNCFFEHFNPGPSLVFFYAKQVPFYEESGKILVGVGLMKEQTYRKNYLPYRNSERFPPTISILLFWPAKPRPQLNCRIPASQLASLRPMGHRPA